MLIPFPSKTERFVSFDLRVYAHNGLIQELRELLQKEEEQIIFYAQYADRIKVLLEHLGTEHLRYSSWFEVLKGEDFRSMKFRIAKLGNLRILYCIEFSSVYLLTAFKEKKTGTDYRPAIRIATSRRKDIEGGS